MNTSDNPRSFSLQGHKSLFIHQIFEAAELFGFETRNKYQILGADQKPIAYAAEQQKGFLGMFLRQFFGHWRSFDVHIFDNNKERVCVAHHPFRFYFNRIEVFDANNKFLGAIQKRFSILTKRFDIENDKGVVLFEVASPFWKIWTFPVLHNGKQHASIQKKWSGMFTELITDKDKFLLTFDNENLSEDEKLLLLTTSVFVDLLYFENKAGR